MPAKKSNPRWDVLVLGGGTAGVVASIQAARLGARTLLVEKNALLGGTMTAGGVAFPGLFHAWGKPIIAGIGWNLVQECAHLSNMTLPDFSLPDRKHWEQQVRLDGNLFAALCFEAVVEAGVQPLLHAMPAEVIPLPDGGWSVPLCTKDGIRLVEASVVVDATGDANAVAMAGGLLRVPEAVQPGTLVYRVSGYDPAALDLPELERRFATVVEQGLLDPLAAGWVAGPGMLSGWLQNQGSNSNHVPVFDGHLSEGRTRLEVEARLGFLKLFRFLKEQPGLAGLRIESCAAECGVRESVTIKGDVTITLADYQSGKIWPDAVCNAFYPIDLHQTTGTGLDYRPLAEGVVPTIPRGALLPLELTGIVVAGRTLSSDRLANSALRVQAPCMAMGQAAGVLAAWSAQSGKDMREMPLEALRATLREHGAIVPEPAP